MNSFNALKKIVSLGQKVILYISDQNNITIEKSVVIQEILEDGFVVDTKDEIEYISREEILKWKLPKKKIKSGTQIACSANSNVITSRNETDDSREEKNDDIRIQTGAQSLSSLYNISEFKLIFAGSPSIVIPEPSFDIPNIRPELRKEIDRWRNRYQYAQKIREPARMSQDVAAASELAATLNNPVLFYLAGYFANISGIGDQKAKEYFKLSLELDYQPAALALSSLFISEQKWENAAKSLLESILLSQAGVDQEPCIYALGQCLLKTDYKKTSVNLGKLLTCNLSETSLEIAKRLITIVVEDDNEALQAALKGDVDELRKTKIGNNLFPWHNELENKRRETKQHDVKEGYQEVKIRKGYISAYYVNRNFGFIVENTTGQTWFFHKNSVENESLSTGLMDGYVRQEIIFEGKYERISEKYPIATHIKLENDKYITEQEVKPRAPLRIRLSGIPKDNSFYSKAKEAEQLDELERADSYFYEEIKRKGKHLKSAIKDLAALRNRMGKPEKAIELLDKYRTVFDTTEHTSLDNMKIQFFVKARKYGDAAMLLARIANKTYSKSKKVEYLRQEAYCYFADGDFKTTIQKLEKLPQDSATSALLSKVKQANDDRKHGVVVPDIEDDAPLSSLALGLSALARKHLDECEFKGTDERSREKSRFEKRDYDQVRRLLSNIKGRRPRDQADYLLSLAALCEKVPDFEQHTQMHTYLMWYFAALAEAAMSEHQAVDVVRSYCIESLRFHSTASRSELENAWLLLLGTYLSNKVGANELLNATGKGKTYKLFDLYQHNQDDWKTFLEDAPYYKKILPVAFKELERHVTNYQPGLPLDINNIEVIDKSEYLYSVFRNLLKISFAIDYFRLAHDQLSECSGKAIYDLDNTRIQHTINICKQCTEYLQERDFREIEAKYLRLDSEIVRMSEDIEHLPTILSFEKILPILQAVQDELRNHFDLLEDATPELELQNVLDSDFYLLDEGNISLRFLLKSKSVNTPPVEAIGFYLDQGKSEPCHSPEPLYGGQSREIELTITPDKKQIEDTVFTVFVVVEYRTRKGKAEKAGPFPIAVRLGQPDLFQTIHNPYGRYAGGIPVDDNSMFFGRKDLIEHIVKYVSSGEQGQCFVLYGQKRSGKSSVINQVEKRVPNSVFFVKISAGNFSPGNLWSSFARILAQEMKFVLEDKNEEVPSDWPNSTDIEQYPVEKIRDICRCISRKGYHIVISVDEFTYIYEHSPADSESFMRGWKALLEAKTFNAILIGQDTMSRFMQAFENEFALAHHERLNYFNREEAFALASQPILIDGETRYRGQALDKLFRLTAGSPYFLQITCDRLVRHLNARKAPFITEADIDYVLRSLTIGPESLSQERFGALVAAAGERVDLIPRQILWQLLSKIARESLQSGWCHQNSLSNIPESEKAIKDLIDRQILFSDGNKVRILVELFTKWLQANQLQSGVY